MIRYVRIPIPVVTAAFVLMFVAALCLGQTACAPTPPTVTTPQGITAFENLQIAKALDAIRDIAVDANATTPPVLATDVTREIVTWHRSALVVLNARSAGWVATLTTSLDQLTAKLSEKDKQLIVPYVTLAKTILIEVTKP